MQQIENVIIEVVKFDYPCNVNSPNEFVKVVNFKDQWVMLIERKIMDSDNKVARKIITYFKATKKDQKAARKMACEAINRLKGDVTIRRHHAL